MNSYDYCMPNKQQNQKKNKNKTSLPNGILDVCMTITTLLGNASCYFHYLNPCPTVTTAMCFYLKFQVCTGCAENSCSRRLLKCLFICLIRAGYGGPTKLKYVDGKILTLKCIIGKWWCLW